jgi:hypothetical protein
MPLDFLSFTVPSQQISLKAIFFLFLPFFLIDILELSILLSSVGCPWI